MTELRPISRVREGRSPIARHGRLRKRGPWGAILSFLGSALAIVLVSSLAVAGIVAYQISQDFDIAEPLPEEEAEGPIPSIGAYPDGFNMLIVGSDRCEASGGCPLRDAELNDVTMLLHVSADGTHATAVSFPRDLIVPIPECKREDGSGTNPAMSAASINRALGHGGLSCVARTVTELTGLKIQFAGLITFKGVIRMSNAVGGVEVCVAGDLYDPYVGLELAKGRHVLKGEDALKFLRSRHGVGTGSDLTRISSQQNYMSSLVRTLKSSDTLSDPTKVLALGRAAAKSMTLSKGLAQLDTMASIALRVKDIPLENISFVQYPVVDGFGINQGKVVPQQEKAAELFNYIRTDEPFALKDAGNTQGTVVDPDAPKPSSTPKPSATSKPSATGAPTATAKPPVEKEEFEGEGTTANVQTCTVPN